MSSSGQNTLIGVYLHGENYFHYVNISLILPAFSARRHIKSIWQNHPVRQAKILRPYGAQNDTLMLLPNSGCLVKRPEGLMNLQAIA
jgi:uncharacterized membrane protein SirB2